MNMYWAANSLLLYFSLLMIFWIIVDYLIKIITIFDTGRGRPIESSNSRHNIVENIYRQSRMAERH